MLFRTAFQGFKITLLSSKGIGYRCDLNEKLFITIRMREFDVSMDFNMLLSEDRSLSISIPKTLVRTAVQSFWISLLSSKANGNPCDLHENLFIIIRTIENDVGLEFNTLGVKIAA